MSEYENPIPILQRKQPHAGQLFQVLPDGRYAFWFDNSTSSTYTECQEKFHLKSVKYQPLTLHRKGPSGAAMNIGSWWSKVSEDFYKNIASAQNPTMWTEHEGNTYPKMPTITDMMVIAAKAWVSEGMDSLQLAQPDKYDKFAIPVAAGQLGKYFPNTDFDEIFMGLYHQQAKWNRDRAEDHRNQAAQFEVDNQPDKMQSCLQIATNADAIALELEGRTSLALGPILMAAEYYQSFALQDMKDWKVIGAELAFGRHGEVIVGETDKVVVYWMGKPDLVIYEEKTNCLAPLDQKTKDYIKSDVQNIWKPHTQTAGYIYSIGQIAKELGYDGITVDRCIISVCGRLRPAEPRKKGDSPKPRFIRVRPHYAVEEIAEWQANILILAEQMRTSLEKNQWTRNDKACHLYAGCDFRGICSRPEGVRPLVIQSDYELKEPWSPFDDDEN